MSALEKVLIANRGEIAMRVARTCRELGIGSVAVFAEDDANSLHVANADNARPLNGRGAQAYLDGDQIIERALETGCDAIHPGYGFLSENASFAAACTREGIEFIGPRPAQLELFGDKAAARALAAKCGVPLLQGSLEAVEFDEARALMEAMPEGSSVMVKALAGGGGRGIRRVDDVSDLRDAIDRCQSEALSGFGDSRVYIEQFLERARHLEIQVIGDGQGGVTHLYERECTLQRRNQKILEIAPSPSLPNSLRQKLTDAALKMAQDANYKSLGTFEFLVDASKPKLTASTPFYFMEANPRIQVEHTVTEEILNLDLIAEQIAISSGRTLEDIGLTQKQVPKPTGYSVQARVNAETIDAAGAVTPSYGSLEEFELPIGQGIRNESAGYRGYSVNPSYDSLLAKIIATVRSGAYIQALNKMYRALCEFKVSGLETNISLLQALVQDDQVRANRVHTTFVLDGISQLIARDVAAHPELFVNAPPAKRSNDNVDVVNVPLGGEAVFSPVQGLVVSMDLKAGDVVEQGDILFVVESMKMEHEVKSPASGIVHEICLDLNEQALADKPVLVLEDVQRGADTGQVEEEVDLDHVRDDLAEVFERHEIGLDHRREHKVSKRHKLGRRSARENINDLCDDGSFREYGPLVIAAQRRRHSVEHLIESSPADGLVAGIGRINGDAFEDSRVVVMSYDYTVMAGTQGVQNHKKVDRLLAIAERGKLPVVLFAEGGGGRPGDVDAPGVSGLDCVSFFNFARLSGKVPLIGVASGRCFAGNAALYGCCDVTIATEDLCLGMGGPAMIEGGGLGSFLPEEVGPVNVQQRNGVLDIVVKSDAEAVAVVKKYLGIMQGANLDFTCADQRELRYLIPENRVRSYDIRQVIETLSDSDSVIELRSEFGRGMVTAFARIEGRPVGIIANNPNHMGGAILSDEADKAARFMKLCNVHATPVLFLCDTPGMIVGPDAEKTGSVRHAARMILAGANLSVPFFTIVTRKAYGLGALAMAGGSFQATEFALSWPTGEMGPMGIEAGVSLGFRKELEGICDPKARKEKYDALVSEYYAIGRALSVATYFEIDDVIDPSCSRDWISDVLTTWDGRESRPTVDPYVDSW